METQKLGRFVEAQKDEHIHHRNCLVETFSSFPQDPNITPRIGASCLLLESASSILSIILIISIRFIPWFIVISHSIEAFHAR